MSSDDDSSDENSVTRCICHKIHNDGMMVQCDNCNVWQHCPCVGLAGITENEMPDQYYCEECKPENHVLVDSYGRYRRIYDPKGHSVPNQKNNKKRTTMNSADATGSIPELYQMLATDSSNGFNTRGSTSPSMTSDTLNPTTNYDLEDTIGPRVSKRRRSTTSTSDTSRSAAQATRRDPPVKPSRSTSPTALKQNIDQENERKSNGRGNKRRAAADKSNKTRVSASPQIAFKELPDGVNTRRRGGAQWRASSPETRQKSNETTEGQDGDAEDEQEYDGQTNGRRRAAPAPVTPTTTTSTTRSKKNGGSETRRRGKAATASPLSPIIDRHIPTKHSPLISHREDVDVKLRAPLSPFEERNSDTESPRVRAKTPPTKIRYPSNKMSLGDMDKRASQILRYINRMQLTMTKKQRSGYHSQTSSDHHHSGHSPVDPVVIPKPRSMEECHNATSNNRLVGELEVVSGNPPIVLQRSLSISSMASSLSSASTIPLNEDKTEEANKQEEEEKGCIPAPEHATALEIMNRLACELVKFQYRFGPQKNNATNTSSVHPPDRSQQRHHSDDSMAVGSS